MPTSSVSKVRRRKIVWSKTPNGICAHCGKVVSAARQTVDHFIPISMGGTDDKYNLMPLCRDCNTERQLCLSMGYKAVLYIQETVDVDAQERIWRDHVIREEKIEGD